MRSWLVALRIARREARRAKGRTALIVAMICLPVLALSYAAATFDMQRLTPAESVTRILGSADGSVSWMSVDRFAETAFDASTLEVGPVDSNQSLTEAKLLALLPAGSTVSDTWERGVSMRTGGGVGEIRGYGIDLTSPLTDGLTRVSSGRAATADNEVVVSSRAMARLGAKVGGTITTTDGVRYTVVGVGEVSGRIEESIVFRPSQRPIDVNNNGPSERWLINQPGPIQLAALNDHGLFVKSRALMLDPPPTPPEFLTGGDQVAGLSTFSLGTLVGGLALLEIVLLAGPAFAVGARRRQRDLALVATNGGTPATLRRIVLADGIVGGAIAAVVGVVLGVGAAFATRPLAEEHLFHDRFGAYRVFPLALLGVAGIALLTGLLSAMVPAFTAARQEIVMALSGRRGVTKSRLIWLLAGIALTVAGAGAAAYGAYQHNANVVLGGLTTGEFGLVLCTPTLVGLIARLSRFLPVAPRMALRDASRRRAAAAPAISAVMAAVAGSIALSVYLGASDAQRPQYVRSLPMGSAIVGSFGYPAGGRVAVPIDKLTSAVALKLPGARSVPFQSFTCTEAPSCTLEFPRPVSTQCPYWQQSGELTKADQLAARADARCDNGDSFSTGDVGQIVTSDPVVVTAATGLAGDQLTAATATLRRGGALVSDPLLIENGSVSIDVMNEVTDSTTDDQGSSVGTTYKQVATLTVPAYLVTTGVGLPKPILSPGVVAAFHGRLVDLGLLVTPARMPTQANEDGLSEAVAAIPSAQVYVERGDDTRRSPVPVILAIAAAVIALGAAGMATGLAAADSRQDLTTLAAVGATPRVRRVLSLAQSGVIAGLGSIIGAVAGLGAAAAVLTGINSQFKEIWPAPPNYPITVPWLNLAISLIVVPLTAMLFAGLLTRSRLPSERRAD